MTRPVVAAAVALALGAVPCLAQSGARDSLLACADQAARAAGFAPAGPARAGRLLLMRPQESPGTSHLLDALRIAVADSAGTLRLEVRVGSFLVSRSTGLTEQEVTPRASLQAFADSVKAGCRS